jgi:hypothetical protein
VELVSSPHKPSLFDEMRRLDGAVP